MIKTSDLRTRDIINIYDGKRLGTINDLEIDLDTGTIKALIVPNPVRVFGFWSKKDDIVIPWDKIKKIGVDVILVDLAGIYDSRTE
ncbi:MAG TPA: YlmC/YmxH family sporulation protein [Clostridia bacterium]|jgi:YlmC/YmxH family sporulation protein|nr:YlmC/YmxH family sporulation protein [Clostridia bacterium]